MKQTLAVAAALMLSGSAAAQNFTRGCDAQVAELVGLAAAAILEKRAQYFFNTNDRLEERLKGCIVDGISRTTIALPNGSRYQIRFYDNPDYGKAGKYSIYRYMLQVYPMGTET
jgi:hypothetical protein